MPTCSISDPDPFNQVGGPILTLQRYRNNAITNIHEAACRFGGPRLHSDSGSHHTPKYHKIDPIGRGIATNNYLLSMDGRSIVANRALLR